MDISEPTKSQEARLLHLTDNWKLVIDADGDILLGYTVAGEIAIVPIGSASLTEKELEIKINMIRSHGMTDQKPN